MSLFFMNCEARGNNLLLTYSHDGETKYQKIGDYKPSLFTESNGPTEFTELVTGKYLHKKQFNNLWDANQAIRAAHDVAGATIYGNRNFHYTFLHENFLNMEETYDANLIRGFYLDIECPSEYGFPEPNKAEWPINLMCIHDTITGKYEVWGLDKFNIDKYIDKIINGGVSQEEVNYHYFDNEVDLLEAMLSYWENNFPQYITGWNITNFDMPYIYNRLQRCGFNANRLSPWGSVRVREFTNKFGKDAQNIIIAGIGDLDYYDIYLDSPATPTRASMKLDFILEIEGLVTKVDFSDVAPDLKTLCKVDWDLYTVYNIIDVAGVKRLEDKLGLINTTLATAYASGLNYSDVSSPVATWENRFYRQLIRSNVILPTKKNHEKIGFEGGYVKDPQIGKHRWVVSFDLASLYPHLIQQYNISPETITPIMVAGINVDTMTEAIPFNMPNGNLSVCPTGNTFKNDKTGIFPEEMLKLYTERKAIKKEMLVHEQDVIDIGNGSFDEVAMYSKYDLDIATNSYDVLLSAAQKQVTLKDSAQMVRKILLNSAYGALANIHFCLFDLRLAESITKSGQLSIRWIGRIVNERLNSALKTDGVDYVVYTDTDSIYVKLEKVVEITGFTDKPTAEIVAMLDSFCATKMEPMINRGYEELAEYTNAYDQKMFMDREVISDNSIFCAKKRYAMSVWNSEGVAFNEPYIKVMGLDLVKSSTPQVCRDAMKDVVRMILNNTEQEVQTYFKGFKAEYQNFTPEQIAMPSGVSSMEEKYCNFDGSFKEGNVYYKSKACIHYNRHIDKLGLDKVKIVAGDKIKYLHLKLPNTLRSKDIGFPDELPKEFNLHHKVDYKVMFEKSFAKPMSDMVNLIGWSLEPRATLNGLLFKKK